MYVDGGPTPGPTPSTIVDFSDDLSGRVLRVGAIPLDELRKLLPGLQGPEPDPVPEETVDEPEASEAPDSDAAVSEAAVPDAVVTTEAAEPTHATTAGTEETTS